MAVRVALIIGVAEPIHAKAASPLGKVVAIHVAVLIKVGGRR
jgi:hypothetical protein